MELVDRCLELRIFCNIILKYLLFLSLYSYGEISGLCIPVSLRLRRDQEFYELPDTFGKYAVPTSNFPFTS